MDIRFNPDQPRDEHGRWEGTGAELHRRLEESGGFTYQPVMNASPQDGYALSILPGNEQVLTGKVDAAQIQTYLDQHQALFESNSAAHVGGWLDPETGKIYLDVSVVEPDLGKALDLARAHNQLAIYDLSKHETIRVDPAKAAQVDSVSFPTQRYGPADRRRAQPFARSAHERYKAMTLMTLASPLLEVKFVDKGAPVGSFSGYGSVFNNTDAYGDVIAPGAFKSTLAQWKARGSMPKMLLQHGGMGITAEDGIPVGKWTHMSEDTKGLAVEGQLFALDTQKGKYIYEGLKSGALDGLSIGYIPVGVKYGQSKEEPERTLTAVDLHECSIVTFPANEEAMVSQCKSGPFGRVDQLSSMTELERFMRDVCNLSQRQAKTLLSKMKDILNQSDSDGKGGGGGVPRDVVETARARFGLKKSL